MITVTKTEAIHRQLDMAIRLWVDDEDPVSVHTLAYSAYQVAHDLNHGAKGPPLLLDMASISPEMRQKFVSIVKRDSNFFKHADGRRKGKSREPDEIEFNPEVNELLLLFAVQGLIQLGEKRTPNQVAFDAWLHFTKPQLFMDAWGEKIKEPQVANLIRGFTVDGKKQFFKTCEKLNLTGLGI